MGSYAIGGMDEVPPGGDESDAIELPTRVKTDTDATDLRPVAPVRTKVERRRARQSAIEILRPVRQAHYRR